MTFLDSCEYPGGSLIRLQNESFGFNVQLRTEISRVGVLRGTPARLGVCLS